MKMKFGDMSDGTHFTDNRRKFIKLRTISPFGLTQTYDRLIHYDNGKEDRLSFNSIDYDGCTSNCPDWVEFELL